MISDIASIRCEFDALASALAELRADAARHGETRLAIRGWWPVERRRKVNKLNLIEARLEGMRSVLDGMQADGVYPSKEQKEDGQRWLRDVVRANPAR
jgi:hypothetical protein